MSKYSLKQIPWCYRMQKSLQEKFNRRKLHKLKSIIAHELANSLYRNYLHYKMKSANLTRHFGIDSKNKYTKLDSNSVDATSLAETNTFSAIQLLKMISETLP